MTRSFNADTVKQLQPDTSSEHLNNAITFCQDWVAGRSIFVFHTSGSTGVPKKIELKRTQLEASALSTIRYLGITADDYILVCLNTHLIAGSMMLVRGLMARCNMYILDPSADPLEKIAPDHEYTLASFAPMQLSALLRGEAEAALKMERFRNILVGGAPINDKLEKKLKAVRTNIFHTYGMTETASHVALRKIGHDAFFTALPGVELGLGMGGELQIRSGATDNKWVVTTDLAELVTADQFVISGRADEMINSGGIKISPARVEQALARCFNEMNLSVENTFVTAVQDEVLGERLVAVHLSPPLTQAEETEVRNRLRKDLHPYEIPKNFYYTNHFETTESGKTDKINTLRRLIK